MFTPDSLLQIAVDAEIAAQTEDCDQRWSLMRRRDAALATAAWMERNGVTEAANIGPFGNIALPSGKVRVRKGAPLRGTGNHVPETTGTSYVIKVVSVDEGYVFDDGRTITLRNQTVHWAGRGGYWRWTDVTNVERI